MRSDDQIKSSNRLQDGERLFSFGRCQLKDDGEGRYELTINKVGPHDTGVFRCICENDWGSERTIGEIVVIGLLAY